MSLGIGRSVAVSGAILGIATGLLLWLFGLVGPILFIPFIILGAVVGAVLFGLPAILFERKVERERRQEDAELAAYRARSSGAQPASPYVVINVASQDQQAFAQPTAAPSTVNIPVYATQPAAPPPSPPPGPMPPGPGAAPPNVPRPWPLTEPLAA